MMSNLGMTKSTAFPISRAIQDYLKAIYTLQQTRGDAGTNQLCARLSDIKPASVTGMCKRLAELGLIEHKPYHGVRLTAHGEHLARKVIRAHRLIELYLVQVMGFEPDKVHREAEAMEHAISDEFIERIAAILGEPQIGAHGEPIPQIEELVKLAS